MAVSETTDWAWFAGLFEGEGFFYATKSLHGTRRFSVRIEMTDLDVLEKAQGIAGGQLTAVPSKHREDLGHKPSWSLKLGTNESLDAVVFMWPYLGERRRERAIELLTERLNDLANPEGKIAHATRETIHFLSGGAWL